MKKMAVITLHDVKNYGSILQTYATQCYFEKMGYEVTIIDYRRPWETTWGYWTYLNERNLTGFARNIMYFPSKVIQYFRFNEFLHKRIKLSKASYKSAEELKNNPVIADVYCTGSDQVWNSGWNEGVIAEYFLNFVDKNLNTKKISFSASFGNSDLRDSEIAEITQYLKEYDLITVREKKSAEFLVNSLNLQAYEILDPTLQMNGDFWKELCDPDRILDQKYVLLIQLNRNHDFDRIAEKFANKQHLKLVRLCLRVDQIFLYGKKIMVPKVENYIALIRDAEYVLTDSFHAISFSVNLNKQFYCYLPEKYAERLNSILEMLDLENRVIGEDWTMEAESIDYTRINKIIDNKRNEAKEIMERVLGNER